MRDEFFAALDPRMRRMPKALVLSHLPPVMFERRDVEMEPKQKKAYQQMVDQMVAELDDDLLVTTSPLVRVTRLLQFASSYAEIEREWNEDRQAYDEHVKLIEPSSKIKAFLNDIDDFGDDSVVVFAVSKQLINMLSARLTKMGIEHGLITGDQNADQRQEAMDKFQAGKIQFMLCTIAAGGTGITLTRARVGVFLQRSWSMIDNIQAEARVHRIGSEQHNSVVIIDYVTADTIEETVINAVEQKSNRLEDILRDKQLLKNAIKPPPLKKDEE
jgi:SNF2 family DNA or RNA helicase